MNPIYGDTVNEVWIFPAKSLKVKEYLQFAENFIDLSLPCEQLENGHFPLTSCKDAAATPANNKMPGKKFMGMCVFWD